MRFAILAVALLLSGCAQAPSREGPCTDSSFVADRDTIAPGETVAFQARFENCGDEPIMYHAACSTGATFAYNGSTYHLGGRGTAQRPPVCAAVIEERSFEPGAIQERAYAWNGTIVDGIDGAMPVPVGSYVIVASFATWSETVTIRVSP